MLSAVCDCRNHIKLLCHAVHFDKGSARRACYGDGDDFVYFLRFDNRVHNADLLGPVLQLACLLIKIEIASFCWAELCLICLISQITSNRHVLQPRRTIYQRQVYRGRHPSRTTYWYASHSRMGWRLSQRIEVWRRTGMPSAVCDYRPRIQHLHHAVHLEQGREKLFRFDARDDPVSFLRFDDRVHYTDLLGPVLQLVP